MFAATAAADAVRHLHLLPKQPKQGEQSLMQDCDVIVFEGTSKTMSKVRISGGGRCNVMHDKTKPLQKNTRILSEREQRTPRLVYQTIYSR